MKYKMKNVKRHSGKTLYQNMLKKHGSCIMAITYQIQRTKKTTYLETYVI